MAVSTDSVVLINPFEVPPEAEEGFIAGWERARDFPATQGGYRSTQLHRSLGSDAEFRFVNVAEWASLGSFQAATGHPTSLGGSCRSRPPRAVPGPARGPAVAEDPGGVVLINAFEVPPEGGDAFLAGWEGTRSSCIPSLGIWPLASTAACPRRSTSGSSTSAATPVHRRCRPPSTSPGSGRRLRPSRTVPIPACTRSSGADGQAKAACHSKRGRASLCRLTSMPRYSPSMRWRWLPTARGRGGDGRHPALAELACTGRTLRIVTIQVVVSLIEQERSGCRTIPCRGAPTSTVEPSGRFLGVLGPNSPGA
jgi:Antibiotic biosynthesis monooxygenase